MVGLHQPWSDLFAGHYLAHLGFEAGEDLAAVGRGGEDVDFESEFDAFSIDDVADIPIVVSSTVFRVDDRVLFLRSSVAGGFLEEYELAGGDR